MENNASFISNFNLIFKFGILLKEFLEQLNLIVNVPRTTSFSNGMHTQDWIT